MLAGSLTEFSLPDVFSLLAATRKTGVLHLTGADAAGRVWVLGGALAYAAADLTRAPLVARLLHGGEVETAAVEPLVRAHAAEDAAAMATALAQSGVATDRISQLVHDQTIDAVFDLSRWADGQFAFEAAPASDLGVPAVAVPEVLEAVGARTLEWDAIVAQLPSPSSVLAPVSRPPLHSGGMVQMTASQWEVFTLVDGVRSVSDLIALTGQGQFVVARLLAGLVADGLVAVREGSGAETLSQQRAHHLAQVEHRVLGAIAPVEVRPPRIHAITPAPDPAPADLESADLESADLESADLESGEVDEAVALYDDAAEGDVGDLQVDLTEGAGLDVESLLHPDDGAAADATSTPDLAEARRNREMVALGLAQPDARSAEATPDPAPAADGRSTGSDLLARLIDGVKGA